MTRANGGVSAGNLQVATVGRNYSHLLANRRYSHLLALRQDNTSNQQM